jgi:hypothetical protein
VLAKITRVNCCACFRAHACTAMSALSGRRSSAAVQGDCEATAQHLEAQPTNVQPIAVEVNHDQLQQDPEGRYLVLLKQTITCVFAMATWFSMTAVISTFKLLWAIDEAQAAVLTSVVNLGFVCGALLIAVSNVADVLSSQTMIGLGCTGTDKRFSVTS